MAMGSTRAQKLLYLIGLGMGRAFYRVSSFGQDRLPEGGFLLLPNHITFVDAIVLQLACRRRIRYIVDESFYRNRFLHPLLELAGCIPISSRRAKEAVRLAAEHLRAGDIVCLFPEGQLTRVGTLLRLQRGYELMARQADAPVVPVWLDQLWGSIFSFQGGRFFKKWPRAIPYHVTVAFGDPIPADKADIASVREELLKLGEFCYSRRRILDRHLAEMCVRGLKRHPFAIAVTDGLDHSKLNRSKILGAAAALSRLLRKQYPDEQRIAIVLPASKGAVIANLAVALAGKVPVGLNFTSGRAALEASCRRANLRVAVTATSFMQRLGDFPWPQHVVKLDELMPPLKGQILFWWVLSIISPTALLLRLLQIPKEGGHDEAILLFTSGSAGEPKGVVLSHRNILGNVSQFTALLNAKKGDGILASLPFFHCFGSTVTLWYPLVEGAPIVTYPNPLEAAKNAALVEKYKLTVLLATPTFLRAYLRKAQPEQLRSLRLTITGAEKLPQDVAKAFEDRFAQRVFEGYGLTETSPVVSVNLPEPKPAKPSDIVQPSSRPGSVGKMAPGIAAEIRDPETDEKLSLHETGMLWLRGPNIFEGYLHDPERTADVLRDGWLKTGDIGRFDEDGFLYIEGRLSRFSKIGGEMVPHEALEHKIIAALGLDGQHERLIAIIGIADQNKGEAVVLLSGIDIDMDQLRTKLREAGVPNLWIPKRAQRVESIPVLASGKLDLGKCQELALKPETDLV
jgi:acyl-[acyl-carrier-protein]-phospholipid O-acyltransferase / long-chain-fatty-acid--[acyl-carrier-protein] ligase